MKLSYKHTQYTCYLCYIGSALVNNFAPLLFVTFQKSLGLNIVQIGVLITANFLTQMVMDFVGANFVDKIGYRTSIMLANILAGVGFLMMANLPFIVSKPFVALVISTVVYAIGSSIMEVLVSPIIEALPLKAKSSALSLLHSFYSWGCVIVIGLSTLFFRFLGVGRWRLLTSLWSVLPFVTAVLFAFVPINTLTEKGKEYKLRDVAGQGLFWVFWVLMVCSGATEMAISQWASFFAEEALGVSKSVGDLLGPCMFAVLMGSCRVLYAVFHKSWRLPRIIAWFSFGCVVAFLTTALCPNPYVSLIGCAVCGFFVAIAWPGVLSLAAANCKYVGTALFGLMALGGDFGCFAGPETVSLVASAGGALHLSPVRFGILISTVFPVMMLMCITILNVKKKIK